MLIFIRANLCFNSWTAKLLLSLVALPGIFTSAAAATTLFGEKDFSTIGVWAVSSE